MTIRFILNDTLIETEANRSMPVLDYVRTIAGLMGTKEGCREGDCGACSVLVGRCSGDDITYSVFNSCLLPLCSIDGCHVVTIEGLNCHELTLVQRAIVEMGGTQCGFCTPGLIVSITGFLLGTEDISYESAIKAIAGNICRCTGYAGICRAVAQIINEIGRQKPDRLGQLIEHRVVPPYFRGIPERLGCIECIPDADYPASGQSIVAGCTDYYVQHKYECLDTDLFTVKGPGLSGVWIENDFLYIGAGTTIDELARSTELDSVIPGMKQFLALFASPQIRNRATIAGNIVNASPIADLAIILLTLHTTVGVKSQQNERQIPLDQFFKGYKKLDLNHNEIVIWFKIDRPHGNVLFNFEKVAKRKYLDIASVNSAMTMVTDGDRICNVRISAGGVAPVPLLLAETSKSICGQPISVETAKIAADCATEEISPIDDVRGTARYKSQLLKHLILAHFHELFDLEDGLL